MRVGIACLAVLLMPSCAYHVDTAAKSSLGEVPSFSRGQLSYALVNQYVFGPKCVQCHGRSGGINLESFAAVSGNISAVEAVALVARSMPKAPAAPLSDSEGKLLRDWIDAGAPELASGDPPPPPPPLEPKFASIHDRIFAKKCFSCHNSGGSAKDIPLDTVADLLGSPDDLVLPGDPDNSYLAILISPGARKPMPPPESGLTISGEEINIIKEWIKNGAKD